MGGEAGRGQRYRGAFDQVVSEQAGVFTRTQAHAAGLSDALIRANLRAGRWQRLLDGVYASFTGEPSRLSRLWAVVLRAGPDAVLSHETAAELSGLSDRPSARIHVTVPAGRKPVRIAGVVIHRARSARAAHPVRRPPQSSVEDAVLDMTQTATDLDSALGWLARAIGSRLTTPDWLRHAIAGRRAVRWRAVLGASLRDIEAGCHSVLELRYLRDVERAHELPPADRQAARPRPGGRAYDDVRYSQFRTVVELDGRAAHPGGDRWRDMRRDNAVTVSGDRVLRYGWADVTRSPCAVARQVGGVLTLGGWTGVPVRCDRPDCR